MENTDPNERIILAIGRIERALSKIENSAKSGADQSKTALAAENQKLEARHEALKDELKQAIGTIDSLIAKQSAGAV